MPIAEAWAIAALWSSAGLAGALMAIDIRWPQAQMPQAPAPPRLSGPSPTPFVSNGAPLLAQTAARAPVVPLSAPPSLVRRHSPRQSSRIPGPAEETRPKVRYNAMATWRHSATDDAE